MKADTCSVSKLLSCAVLNEENRSVVSEGVGSILGEIVNRLSSISLEL